MHGDVSLIEYKNMVRSLAENNEALVTTNSSPEHAVIVMSTIFDFSTKAIRIFAENFNGEISDKDEYIDSLEQFILRGGTVTVLLHEYNYDNNPKLFDLLKLYYIALPNQIGIKTTDIRIVHAVNETDINFTVADDKIYRIEEDINNKIARCCFNDSDTSLGLRNLFDSIYNDEKSTKTIVLN